jgi:hypothetical protein
LTIHDRLLLVYKLMTFPNQCGGLLALQAAIRDNRFSKSLEHGIIFTDLSALCGT